MIHCAGCGYPEDTHDPGTRKCHPATGDKNGRRGTFRVPPPVDRSTWQEIVKRDVAARFAAIEAARAPYVPPPPPRPPQVPARAPHGLGEVAGYQGRQAVGLGRAAIAAGWRVAAYYARGADGEEMSAVKLARGDLQAVAVWRRAAGNIGKRSGWSADVAFGWRIGTMPARINHTDLERLINDLPD
jgi:hypothetical protein